MLALAGVAQAVQLLDTLAETGQCSKSDYSRNVLALLNSEPDTDQEIFGEPGELDAGLKLLQVLCTQGGESRKMRYVAQILYLQKRLMRRKDVLGKVASGIKQANRQLEFYGTDSDALVFALDDLYQSTLSTLGFRIQIYGQHDFLSQQRVAAQVRTLLFSGVRFSLLWRQFGGSSAQLLLSKRSLADLSKQLIKNYNSLEKNDASN